MQKKTRVLMVGGLLVGAALVVGGQEVVAADHVDSPQSMGDAPADITDLYAWAEGESVVLVLGFAGLAEAGLPAT